MIIIKHKTTRIKINISPRFNDDYKTRCHRNKNQYYIFYNYECETWDITNKKNISPPFNGDYKTRCHANKK